MVRAMLNRPAAQAESQDLNRGLEAKVTRRPWNPALHPRDRQGRFIETGGVVRLWGGKLARVVRALPHDRVLVQDQSGRNQFNGRRHTTSAKWVTMVTRPDGTAPTENAHKVAAEDERRTKDPRRGNGVARDDAGDPTTPDHPHHSDDQGRPIGEDHGDGPDDGDDEDEPADGHHPINVHALPNQRHAAGARFADTAAVRQHFIQLAGQPGTRPQMATFLRSVAGDDDLHTTRDGRLAILRDDSTGRWYLTATGTGQRMDAGGDFTTPQDAARFAAHLDSLTGDSGAPFDFSDPNLNEAARSWKSSNGENIQQAIKRARAEFDRRPAAKKTAAAAPGAAPGQRNRQQTPAPDAPAVTPPRAAAEPGGRASTVAREDLKPGDRVKVTVRRGDIEWPDSTRDQDKPEAVTVEGTVAPTYSPGPGTTGAPLVDVTLTGPDGNQMTTGDTTRVLRMPSQVEVTGSSHGFAPEQRRADRVRVGDVVARGDFGHVVTRVDRHQGGRTFTTRHLGGRGETDQFGARSDQTLDVVPRANRRPEDVQRDVPDRTQRHASSQDAKRAALSVLSNWHKVDKLAGQQWPDGPPEQFRALAEHMRNVTDVPRGVEGYQKNADAMRGALAALDTLDTEGVNPDLLKALHRLEEDLDAHADRFDTDAGALAEHQRLKELQSRRPVGDLTDDQLRAEYDELTSADFRTFSPKTQSAYESRLRDIKQERRDRDKRAITGREDPSALSTEQLRQEQAELARARTSYEADDVAEARKQRAAAVNAELERRGNEETGGADQPDDAAATPDSDGPGTVTMTPDEVSQQLDAVRPGGSKAPSSMSDAEIRDEIVDLMGRDMAGELSGADRTRLQVLEAEEARRAGRAPKRDEAKPKPAAAEPGGLFDVAEPAAQQPLVADPDNPLDRPDDEFGTPDMFADAEGRDTSKLRAPQTRPPMELQRGDRFVDANGRTHTVAEDPVRTGRGRVRVVDDNGGEHFLNPDNEVRVLHPDEDAPQVPASNEPDIPRADAEAADTPDSGTPDTGAASSDTDAPPADEPTTANTPAPTSTGSAEEPAAEEDRVRIDHSGTGTTVHFPTPNGMVSDQEFAVLRRLGFKASRDRTKPRFFYLPSTMTLSRRDDRVRQLKEWLDRRNVAYHAPEDDGEKPELTPEQLEQLKGRYFAPDGTWATTDFQPGDEVWTGSSWYRVDSVGPKNLRLQGWGPTPYDRVLARRRGSEIRTILDAPADDGTPRPGSTDPKLMRDEQIAAELDQLQGARLPEGNDPATRAVRRQVTARVRALTDAQSQRVSARRHDEMNRRDRAKLVRDPARLASLKGEQVQGRDGALIGAVYPEKKGKWVFLDRDGRVLTAKRYPTRAAAITALNQVTDTRNERAGEGWKHSAWDDVQPGDTIRLPTLSRTENGHRTVTGWSDPLEVSEIRRGDMGQLFIRGRRDDQDVTLEVPRTDATFGAAKPGNVPEREPSEAGGGLDWRQMRPDDFGQNEIPAAAADQNAPGRRTNSEHRTSSPTALPRPPRPLTRRTPPMARTPEPAGTGRTCPSRQVTRSRLRPSGTPRRWRCPMRPSRRSWRTSRPGGSGTSCRAAKDRESPSATGSPPSPGSAIVVAPCWSSSAFERRCGNGRNRTPIRPGGRPTHSSAHRSARRTPTAPTPCLSTVSGSARSRSSAASGRTRTRTARPAVP